MGLDARFEFRVRSERVRGIVCPSFIAVRSISVETDKCFPDKAVGKRLAICRFDGYECFRNLCCFSRFYSDFQCSRFVQIRHGRSTRKMLKVVS